MMVSSDATTLLGLFGMPGGAEWIVLLLLGLLVFGRRLPEVGRSLGSSIVEFKKGIKGIEDDVDTAVDEKKNSRSLADDPAHRGDLPNPSMAGDTMEAKTPNAGQQSI